MQAVTVISPETRLFRVKISHVYAMDLNVHAGRKNFWFEGNFDNFRTFISPACDATSDVIAPRWSDWEVMFVYETQLHHLLLAKLLSFTVYCEAPGESRSFVGEASCDLLHVALGPPSLLLTIKNGDVNVGDLILHCEMEEVAESKVVMRSFEITTHDNADFDIAECSLAVESKCRSPQVISAGKPGAFTHGLRGTWENVGTHYLGTTAMELFSDAGLRFELSRGFGSNVARGLITFGNHMTPEMRLQASQASGRPGKIEQEIYFENAALMNEDGSAQIGTISGLVYLTDMPYYVQMYSGTNIDGEIFDGKRYHDDLPLPPNVAEGSGPARA